MGVPKSTLCTHAPLLDLCACGHAQAGPGWIDDPTVTQRHRVLPSASMQRVGFPRLYNISGLDDAACVLATTVLHGYPRGIPRRIRYRPADGLWPGGNCTHWLIITNFTGATLAPHPKVSVINFILAHAFAFGRDQHGNSKRTGGWGYLLGDEGAGFGLGLSAIRAALQALEQTGPDTSLKEALLPYFGIRHLTRLKTIVYTANFQHRIADFSKILFEHAEQDDPVAVQIVNEGAKQMVRLVDPLLKQLDFDHATIALTGALYTNVSAYYHLCKLLLKEQYTETVHVKLGEKSILDGAIWLGKKFLEENRNCSGQKLFRQDEQD